MANQNMFYHRTALTGGTAAALDGIDGNDLGAGCWAITMVGGVCRPYLINIASSATADGVDIIAPATNPGTKRWYRQTT
jgi:hypothetical protein